jgi:hypothetical protein
MSMEIYVLSNKRLPSIAAWQQALDREGFDLVLDAGRPFARLQGHLPATWRGRPAGFECDHWNPDDVLKGSRQTKFEGDWKYCLAFRWGADPRACLGVYMAAAAYAKATDGVVFDCDTSKVLTPQQARQEAVTIERQLPLFEQKIQSVMAVIERTGRLPT